MNENDVVEGVVVAATPEDLSPNQKYAIVAAATVTAVAVAAVAYHKVKRVVTASKALDAIADAELPN